MSRGTGADALRSPVLAKADEIIHGARRDDYGDASDSFTRIAALWSATLGHQVTAHDVALCLAQLKIARAINCPGHVDSYVDLAGYAALAAQLTAGQDRAA